MLPDRVLELRYCLTAGGESPFESWFSDLDAAAAAKVWVALVRLGQGNTSNAGETVVILLTGGAKQRQQRDMGEGIVDGLQAAAKTAGTINGGERWR